MSLKRKLSAILSMLSVLNIPSVNAAGAQTVNYNTSDTLEDDDAEDDEQTESDADLASNDQNSENMGQYNYIKNIIEKLSDHSNELMTAAFIASICYKSHEKMYEMPVQPHKEVPNKIPSEVNLEDGFFMREKVAEEDWPEKIEMSDLKTRAEKLWQAKGYKLIKTNEESVSVKGEIWTKEVKDEQGNITTESKLEDDKTLLYYAPDGLFGPFYVVSSENNKEVLDTVKQGKLPPGETELEDVSEKRNSMLVDLLKQLQSGLQKELTLTDKDKNQLDLSLGDVLYIMKKVVEHRKNNNKQTPELDVFLYLCGIRPRKDREGGYVPDEITLFPGLGNKPTGNLTKPLLGGFLGGFLGGGDGKLKLEMDYNAINTTGMKPLSELVLFLPLVMPALGVGIPNLVKMLGAHVIDMIKVFIWSNTVPVYDCSEKDSQKLIFGNYYLKDKNSVIEHNNEISENQKKLTNSMVDWTFKGVMLNNLWKTVKEEISRTLKSQDFQEFFVYLVSSLTNLQKTVESVVALVNKENVLDKLGNGVENGILKQVVDLKQKVSALLDNRIRMLKNNYENNKENQDTNDKNLKNKDIEKQIEKIKEFGEKLDKMDLIKSKKTKRALALIKDLMPLLIRKHDDTTLDGALADAEYFDRKIVAFHE